MGGDLIITGGMPLNGTVHIPAAKNSVLPLLAAALLCNGTVRFLQVPHLADVDTSVELLQGAGCTARWQGSDITVQGRWTCTFPALRRWACTAGRRGQG